MLRLDQIDLPELAEALNQRDYDAAGYLDPATGRIHFDFDEGMVGVVVDDDVDLDDCIPLGGEGGHRVYRDMQIFADCVGDRRIRRQLRDALDGPRPMRAFRSVVHSTPEMLGRTWSRFGDIRAQLRALDFLGAGHLGSGPLVAQAELDERRAELVESGDALLESLGGGSAARLILLNGLPGVGKSTLAREYVATRPGVLNLDIDVLRTLLGGPWEETAELGRTLALSLIESHLDTGHDVVVPQLVADPEQLDRFEAAAGDFELWHVLVEGGARQGDEPWRASASPEELRAYADGLDRMAGSRPDLHHLRVVEGDVTAGVAALEAVLAGA